MLRHLARGVGRVTDDLVMTRGSGTWMYTQCGRKLLDMTSGIGVVSTGHCHPKVVAAAQDQIGNLIHGQVNIAVHDKVLELTEKLLPLLPQGLDSMFYTNSGAEAVENAIKMARTASGKTDIIVMQGSYHGRTLGTMAMTNSSRIYRQNFGPFMPGVHVAPFPYEYHGISSDDAMERLELMFKQSLHEDEVAAIVLEPVLGEGGYVPAPRDYLQKLRKFCTERNILLVMDEVQTGFGRTGSLFACDSEYYGDVSPDILIMAKGIASGFPISAVASRLDLTDKQVPGTFGGTYTGNAVACAAALATIDVIEEEGLIANSMAMGQYLKDGLGQIQQDSSGLIGDVRGLGCMVGVEFSETAPAGIKSKIVQRCLDKDMLILGCSVYETLRFIPPLTVNKEEIDLALETFSEVIKEA